MKNSSQRLALDLQCWISDTIKIMEKTQDVKLRSILIKALKKLELTIENEWESY